MRIAIDLDGPIAQHGTAKDWWNPEHWLDLEETPMALGAMFVLDADGHDVTIVTARDPHPNTQAWLDEHCFDEFPIVHTKHKYTYPAHVYLDDSVMQLEELGARRCTTVKWVTRMNVGARANFTVETWPEFVALIRSGKVKGKLKRRPRKVRVR